MGKGAVPWRGLCAQARGEFLNATAAVAGNDVWAVGTGGLIEHFDGTSWSVVPNLLGGVTALPGGTVVAAGSTSDTSGHVNNVILQN
jgi:hypothetical protein